MGNANKRYRSRTNNLVMLIFARVSGKKFPREHMCCYQRVSLHDLRYLLARIVISISVTHNAVLGVG